jgi:hypothetical protein
MLGRRLTSILMPPLLTLHVIVLEEHTQWKINWAFCFYHVLSKSPYLVMFVIHGQLKKQSIKRK